MCRLNDESNKDESRIKENSTGYIITQFKGLQEIVYGNVIKLHSVEKTDCLNVEIMYQVRVM